MIGLVLGVVVLGAFPVAAQFVGTGILFDLGGGAGGFVWGPCAVACVGWANPAGLGWNSGIELCSGTGTQLGAAQVLTIDASGPGWRVEALALDAGEIVPGLRYRVEGLAAGGGLTLGNFGLGVQARVLRPVAPVKGLGWSLDLGLLWSGPLALGLVGKSVISSPCFPGEDWPRDLALGLAWPWTADPWSGVLAFGLQDVLAGTWTWAVAGEVAVGPVALRVGLRPDTLLVGGSVTWALFRLDWGYGLHSILPPSFRVSLAVRFE